MKAVVSEQHTHAANKLREVLAAYEKNRDLILLGAYNYGTDATVDYAIDKIEEVENFLKQRTEDSTPMDETVQHMLDLFSDVLLIEGGTHGEKPPPPPSRLQTLFDIREKEKKAAEDVYAQKKRKVLEEEQTLKEMQDKHAEMIAMREAKLEYAEKIREGGMKISKINANDRHIARLKEKEVAYLGEIDKQKEAVKIGRKSSPTSDGRHVRSNKIIQSFGKA